MTKHLAVCVILALAAAAWADPPDEAKGPTRGPFGRGMGMRRGGSERPGGRFGMWGGPFRREAARPEADRGDREAPRRHGPPAGKDAPKRPDARKGSGRPEGARPGAMMGRGRPGGERPRPEMSHGRHGRGRPGSERPRPEMSHGRHGRGDRDRRTAQSHRGCGHRWAAVVVARAR